MAASFIWGVNTLFLLDAGLTNAQAFGANAFFTAGQVLFEVPTGVVADRWGRRTSFLLGAATLLLSTALYWAMWRARGPYWGWAGASVLLGLGFTFFSGATEAWLVDALAFAGAGDRLERVLARGQVFSGAAMLAGSVAGGYLAQAAGLGAPYLARCAFLALLFAAAWAFMRDQGFSPARGKGALAETRRVLRESLVHGLGNPPVRWMMLASLFTTGAGFYVFYALQPRLLELWGDPKAYGIAGLAAASAASADMAAGLLAPRLRGLFSRRTTMVLAAAFAGCALLAVVGLASSFWVALGFVLLFDFTWAASKPVRSAYLNGLIPSAQRATVLSFDGLMGSAGGVVVQPALGRVADAGGYGLSYLAAAAVQAAALPLVWLARREDAPPDRVA